MKSMLGSVALLLCLVASPVAAQQLPEFPAPQKEHQLLQKFVGQWESESEGTMGPGQPVMKCKGPIHGRALGGFWVVCDMKSEIMGMHIDAVLTLGFDPASKKYVGTWVDSMMNHLWKYEGTVDASGKILTLEAEGPNFTQPGKTSKFRDVYEFKDADNIAISSAMRGDDGKWITFMTGKARRKSDAD